LHEHIPDASEIDTFVDDITNDLRAFESGEDKWYRYSKADYARLVIKNRASWHEWRAQRTHARCLDCGSSHLIKIDPELFSEWDGKLPFSHPGCGGSLIFSIYKDEPYISWGRPRTPRDNLAPDHLRQDYLITYITYSYEGLPIGDQLEEAKGKLEVKYPGLLDDFGVLVSRVSTTEAESILRLSLPSIADRVMQILLASAVAQFIRSELDDQPPDPNDGASLQKSFPEIHKLSAVLIRDLIERLPAKLATLNELNLTEGSPEDYVPQPSWTRHPCGTMMLMGRSGSTPSSPPNEPIPPSSTVSPPLTRHPCGTFQIQMQDLSAWQSTPSLPSSVRDIIERLPAKPTPKNELNLTEGSPSSTASLPWTRQPCGTMQLMGRLLNPSSNFWHDSESSKGSPSSLVSTLPTPRRYKTLEMRASWERKNLLSSPNSES